MNRRDLLKLMIAAPVLGAVPAAVDLADASQWEFMDFTDDDGRFTRVRMRWVPLDEYDHRHACKMPDGTVSYCTRKPVFHEDDVKLLAFLNERPKCSF